MDGCWRMWGCGQSAAHRLDLDEEILDVQTEPWPWPTLVFAIVSVPQFPYLQKGSQQWLPSCPPYDTVASTSHTDVT